jgi:hypothetical protein
MIGMKSNLCHSRCPLHTHTHIYIYKRSNITGPTIKIPVEGSNTNFVFNSFFGIRAFKNDFFCQQKKVVLRPRLLTESGRRNSFI